MQGNDSRVAPYANRRAGDANAMTKTRRRNFVLAATAVAGLLAGCAETEFAVDAMKGSGGGKRPSVAKAPKSSGYYKVGSPYKIKGVWYYPEVDYDYDRTGIASWYGPGFHGRSTANG